MRYATTDCGPYLTCKCTGDDADIACVIVAVQNYSSSASGLANARDAAGGTYFLRELQTRHSDNYARIAS